MQDTAKTCTILPDELASFFEVIPDLPPFSFGPKLAVATTPPLDGV